ncbi:hypothetical protein TI39_contig311g00019 [Zymoseptoria brevis]|uniref:SET domain-containing protein n=1 Tax=Zymoseptoria brevis TaxID=1047168 RepID=A0A0F4GTN7_9PEZI|nr:hypothetical protein TI39_contig311g00019 [Zymoseptoria brevis]
MAAGKKAKAQARKAAKDPLSKKELPESFEHFEFRPAPGKGMGAFATKAIRTGTVLFVEKPLFTIHSPDDDLAELEIQRAYAKLSAADKKKFDALRDPKTEAGKNPFGLKFYKFSANAFQSGDGSSSCHPIGSRFNHSCQPNAVSAIHGSGHAFKTLVEIKQDDEITFCYMEHLSFMTTDERRPQLEDRLDGDCKCELCSLPPTERLVSDMRRFLIRRLLYKVQGKDFPGATPLVKGLKRYGHAAYGEVTLFALLAAKLAEAEGVIAGNTAQFMFTLAAKFLVIQYYSKGLKRISQTAQGNVRVWLQKSAEFIERTSQDVLGDGDVDWADTRRLINSVGKNGELPPLGRFKEFGPRVRGRDF